MRIAILTYWTSDDNYGQILQCFALQHYLRGLRHDAFLVKYNPADTPPSLIRVLFSKLKHSRSFFAISHNKSDQEFLKKEKELRRINHKINIQRGFNEFLSDFLVSTDIIYTSIDELRDHPPVADAYICGSDQVWRDSLAQPNIAGWYLQFGSDEVKRISYAPSIGRSINKDEEKTFKRYLSVFDAISLREQSACDYCRSIGYSDATVVCDPTILLPGETYIKKFQIKRERAVEPYVFFYTLNILSKEDLPWEALNNYITQQNLGIKSVGSSGYYQARNIIPDSTNIAATIPEWLSLIFNSVFIVTTSFHGLIFSVLLHKPFIAIPLKGSKARANDRIINLLSGLGLESRICHEDVDVVTIVNSPIDWDEVEKKLSIMRDKGTSFLAKNLVI